jgi:hypothetical protein
MQIALSMLIIGCIAGALYLHRKRNYRTSSFHELIFWTAVIVTLIFLFVTIYQ